MLLTRTLAKAVSADLAGDHANVHVLPVDLSPTSVFQITASLADSIREPLLAAFHQKLECPCGVSYYPFSDGSWVLENFTNQAVITPL